VLDSVLGKLARQQDANVLVGFDTADDAGVYQLTPELALVQTIDFFTPIVDDPFTFGQIAATNALSDVYAMGGRPISSLAMVCFPDKGDVEILEHILAGGLSKMMEAGCTVIGGHSIRDPEIKFGYSVTGTIDPRRIFANSAAQDGDALVFTKGLGTGVISTAIKKEKAEPAWIEAATLSMTTLNKISSEIAQRFSVHGMTDVTGFGLIGHAREMALGSKVGLRITASSVPLLEGALTCVDQGYVPGGLLANRDFAECLVTYAETVPANLRTLLYDPQTAGGLLISLPAAEADQLVLELHSAGIFSASHIGEVFASEKPAIHVL
jgi:selenide, water dikinase